MGTLLDAISKEDRVEVTFSDFYRLIRESTSAELMKNAVDCNVPHRYRMVKGGRNMWILTQNKERLLTTESMDEIRIAAPGTGRPDYVLLLNRKTDRKEFALGFYRRKERAKEVLQAILKEQSNYISCTGGTDLVTGRHQPAFVAIPPKTYVMPKDE